MEQLRYRTKAQHKVLFGLLARLGQTEERGDLAYSYSNGRTESTSKLTTQECQHLIDDLQEQLGGSAVSRMKSGKVAKLKRTFFAICHKLEWHDENNKLDYPRINNWLLKYGHLKKPLDQYRQKELVKLIAQMDRLLEKMQKEK